MASTGAVSMSAAAILVGAPAGETYVSQHYGKDLSKPLLAWLSYVAKSTSCSVVSSSALAKISLACWLRRETNVTSSLGLQLSVQM